jgi:hypothetical protein
MSEHCNSEGGLGFPELPDPVPWNSRSLNLPGLALVALSIGLIAFGVFHTVEVRTVDADELAELLEFHPFEDIDDLQLIIDTTFTGVIRRNGAIYSNYDRSAPPQKRSCPT